MKRFSVRETALLMAPVLLMGGLGWWISKRSPAPRNQGPLRLKFHVENPTTLEALRGANTAFVVEVESRDGQQFWMQQSAAYLQVQRPKGNTTSWHQKVHSKTSWDAKLWNYYVNNSRFLLNTNALPAGTLQFGVSGIAEPLNSSATPLPIMRLSEKWKVDRTQIKPLNLASLPRKPLVSLRQVKITRINKGNNLSGEAIFHLDGAAMDAKTTLELDFKQQNGSGMSSGWNSNLTPETARRRVREWTVLDFHATKIRVTGRVSADNRWPLGFQIEPFNFKTAKVGQKLKFKQFPVPLPQN